MRRYNFMLVASLAMIGAIVTYLIMLAPWLYALIILAGLCALPIVVKVFAGFIRGMPNE